MAKTWRSRGGGGGFQLVEKSRLLFFDGIRREGDWSSSSMIEMGMLWGSKSKYIHLKKEDKK